MSVGIARDLTAALPYELQLDVASRLRRAERAGLRAANREWREVTRFADREDGDLHGWLDVMLTSSSASSSASSSDLRRLSFERIYREVYTRCVTGRRASLTRALRRAGAAHRPDVWAVRVVQDVFMFRERTLQPGEATVAELVGAQ
jgi:hypothetical protein